MAEDAGRLLVRIEATQAKFEKQMAAIAKSGAASAKSVETNFKKANDNIARGSPQAAAAIGKSTQAASQLSFQLNDIATSLAGGASPFQVMMQQGSQVTQVFQQMGGGLKGAASALGGAFASMLNPISLVSFALIAATGYAVQFFTATEEGSEDAAKALKTVADQIDAIAKKHPTSTVIKDIANETQAAANAAQDAADKQTILTKVYEQADAAITNTTVDLVNLTLMLQDLGPAGSDAANQVNKAMNELRTAIKDRADLTEALAAVEAALRAAEAQGIGVAAEYAKSFRGIADTYKLAAERGAEAKAVFADTNTTMLNFFQSVSGPLAGFIAAMRGLSELDFSKISGAILQAPFQLSSIHDEAVTATPSAAKTFLKTKKAASEEVAERIDLYDDAYATALAKLFTILPDSARILSGVRTFDEQQAIRDSGVRPAAPAGTSHHEQRGNLRPQAADITGVSPEVLKAAVDQIKELETLKGKTYERDKMHVQLAGTQAKAEDAAAAAIQRKADALATSQKNLQDYLASLDEQASLQQRINDINASGLSADEKTTAIAVETELQKALNLAKQNDITLTEQQIALIRQKAVANAAADISAAHIKDAAKLQADALKDAQRAAEDFQRATQAAVGGLIKDLIAGKDAAEAFSNALQKIADKAIDMAIQNLFSMGGPGGAGGLLGVLGFHKGGIVGVHGEPRTVSASSFAGAKRYHSGGMIGAGEVPAILKRGEIVLPAGSAKKGGGSGDTVDVRLHDDSGRMAEIADQRIQTASGTIIKVSVVQSAKTVQRQLPGMMANAQVRTG